MINIRKNNTRGHVNYGWLDSYYTFSFGNYYDPANMGFSKLRVINEDWISGGGGFDAHPHKDMEIITYVMEGALEHKDSMGNKSVINKGDFQKMTAGKGVLHSEYNASKTETVHIYQIWILPNESGLTPNYEQVKVDMNSLLGKMQLVASGIKDKKEGHITVNQDVYIYLSAFEAGTIITHEFRKDRNIWVQVLKGNLSLSGINIQAGDGAAISNEENIEIIAESNTDVLLFDMN